MRIGIVGGGITGLTVGYRLSKTGHQVTIFEKENYLGGLAAGFKKRNWQWSAEKFFHHFFASDDAVRNLLQELGLLEKLFYIRARASIFKNDKISQFDSPFSVLTFSYLSPIERFRVGLVTFYLKAVRSHQKFEPTTAQNWLRKSYGQNSYQLLWQPLLQSKFGQYAPKISMAWFWARIKKRSQKLGYLEAGFQVLIDRLAEKIKENRGKIFLNREVKNLNNLAYFDKAIITVPTAEFLKMRSLAADYRKKLSQLKFVGALNLILILKEKFLQDGTYWLNINEKGFPFVAVIEHTNFVEPKYYGGDHLLYVGGYYPQNHPYFKMNKKEILKEFFPYLQRINPKFSHLSFVICHLSFNLYAQPVIPVNYSKLIPTIKTPLKNVYLANQSLIYPWDRGVNSAIELGEKVAHEVLKEI